MNEQEDYPIVLAHGIARFDALWHPLARLADRLLPIGLDLVFDRFNYFRNIRGHLMSRGFEVYYSDAPFAGSLKERAAALAGNVNAIFADTKRRVHVIGHSMGGLDARYAIAELGLAPKVAVLSTLGTPHLGTSVADSLLTRAGYELIELLRPVLSLEGLADLTSEKCARFNAEHEQDEAANGVRYQIYGATEEQARVFAPLRRSWKIISDREGANDGLVSLKSQLWSSAVGTPASQKPIFRKIVPFPLDHLNECGWWDPAEPEKRSQFEDRVKDLYLEIARNGQSS